MKTKISVSMISVLLAIFFAATVHAWDLPLNVDVFKIKFDHGGDNSALDICINNSLDVSIPEFSYYAQISRPAYIKNASPRIEAMFTAFPPDTGTSLTIGATSADSTWSMNTVEVFFNGSGISIGDTGYVPLSTLSGRTIPSTVGIDSVTWAWKVTKIGNTEQTPPLSVDTSYHGYYVLLDTPQAPMTEPWMEVLNRSCSQASGTSTSAAATAAIMHYLYNLGGISYDNVSGSPRYTYTNDHNSRFMLTDFITIPPTYNKVNCYDMAKALVVFCNAIGCNVYYQFCYPFGYLNCVKPVGLGWTNNPMYGNPNWNSNPIVNGDWSYNDGRSQFYNHAFVTLSGNVYDATMKVDTDDDPDASPVTETWNEDIGWSTYRTRVIDDYPISSTPYFTQYDQWVVE